MARYTDLSGDGRASQNKAGQILGAETTLLVIAMILYILRMYSRIRPTLNLSWDDLFMTLAVLAALGNYIVACMSIPQGFGRHIEFLSPDQIESFTRLTFISEPCWVWSLTFVKISVAFMFLRIQKTKFWKSVMAFAIFYLLASAIITTSLQFTECTPLRMYWDPKIPGGKCRTPHEVQSAIIGCSVVFIVSDFLFSLLPITFIVKINRSVFEKTVLCGIMGLGLIASISGIIKLVGITKWASTTDPTWDLEPLLVWAYAEEYIAICAACIPCLKGPFTKMFKSISSRMTSMKTSRYANGTGGSATKSGNMSELDKDIEVSVTVDVKQDV